MLLWKRSFDFVCTENEKLCIPSSLIWFDQARPPHDPGDPISKTTGIAGAHILQIYSILPQVQRAQVTPIVFKMLA